MLSWMVKSEGKERCELPTIDAGVLSRIMHV